MSVRKVRVYPLSDGQFTSQIYAGLFDLAHTGEIELEFTSRPKVKISERRDWGSKTNHRLVYLELTERDREPIKICYDMLDGPAIISMNGIELCDVYFKRSYLPSYLDMNLDMSELYAHYEGWQTEHPEWKSKILPYGLNCPCRSEFEFAGLRRYLAFMAATKAYRESPIRIAKLLIKKTLASFRKNTTSGPIEVMPTVASEPLILFQTRVFNPRDHVFSDEIVELNKARVETIEALRQSFGNQFIGGLMPDDFARKHYPGLITRHGSSRKEYLELVRRCQVVVFTRGIRQSIGWRFPEYLAASRCIVTEPLLYHLPTPLLDGVNFLSFKSPEQCIISCRKLLNDPDLAQNMRAANFSYYEDNVKPAALVRRTLDAASAHMQSK